MSINRRQALAGTAALCLAGWGSARVAMAAESPAVAFLDKSQLIYLTPMLADGRESTCHGEVWFVHRNREIFVITKSDAWRAEALRRGLRRAAIWIGEFGVWKQAKDRYRSAWLSKVHSKPTLRSIAKRSTSTASSTKVNGVRGGRDFAKDSRTVPACYCTTRSSHRRRLRIQRPSISSRGVKDIPSAAHAAEGSMSSS